jgi:general stress protein YciG
MRSRLSFLLRRQASRDSTAVSSIGTGDRGGARGNSLFFGYQEIKMPTSKSSGGESKRGFASMDENKQREIASKGGKAAHEKGTAHEFDSAEAREAGRKGGEASRGGKSGGSHSSSSGRGGSSAQHPKGGSQSHKNH